MDSTPPTWQWFLRGAGTGPRQIREAPRAFNPGDTRGFARTNPTGAIAIFDAPAYAAPKMDKPLNVLLVDDMEAYRKMLRMGLELEGLTIHEAGDGVEALAVLGRHKIDVVITDILMPRMDGFRLCQEIRRDELTRGVPVLVYTGTYKSASDKKLALEIGADRFIKKPASTRTIVAALREAAVAATKSAPKEITPAKELGLMKEYNERLVRKLEDKLVELEQAKEALDRKNRELQRLADDIRLLLESTGEGIYGIDVEGRCTFINKSATAMTGYTVVDALGKPMHELIHHHRADGTPYPLEDSPIYLVFHTGRECRVDSEVVWRRNGTSFPVEYSAHPILERNAIKGAVVTFNDITERKRIEAQINASLREKEVLLKEIHHRVKNNLQVVSSLLNLQSDHVADEAVRVLLRESQNRVRSMALIHEKLYQSRDFAQIDFAEYVTSLVAMLIRSYHEHSANIKVESRIRQVNLGLDLAIPVGLMLNELVSNAFKHAFPGGREGTITSEFDADENERITLVVRDDGIGLPAGFSAQKSTPFGLHLVQILTQQIRGEWSFRNVVGAEFKITFQNRKT